MKFTCAYDVKAEIPGGVSRYIIAHACGPLRYCVPHNLLLCFVSINLPMYSVCKIVKKINCTPVGRIHEVD